MKTDRPIVASTKLPELAKLLREQQEALDNDSHPLAIERINDEIWTLRNKYACGSTWGKDPVFDKWWVKQVAKARHLNIIRQILMWIAIGAVAIFFVVESKSEARERALQNAYYNAHPDEEEPDPSTYIDGPDNEWDP
jgi:hypothetical protein